MKGDIKVVYGQVDVPVRVAASATRYYSGEPMIQDSVTWSSGAAGANVFTVAAIDTLVIGTDVLGGIAHTRALPLNTGTLVAHTAQASRPIPQLGRLRGRAETYASIDTEAEILAIIQDFVLIDYSATGSVSSGPLYTIKQTASADTSGFQVFGGDPVKGTLDLTVDQRCYRFDVT